MHAGDSFILSDAHAKIALVIRPRAMIQTSMEAAAETNTFTSSARPRIARLSFWMNALAVFLIAWTLSFLISYFFFPARFLVVDDPITYRFFNEYPTWQFLCLQSRLYSNSFIWLAIRLCDTNIVGLKIYGSGLFAVLVLSLFLLNYAISRKYILSWILSLPIVISRLNWYSLIAIQGMMESVSLTACCLSAFFLVLFVESRKDRFFFASCLFYLFCLFGHERYFPAGLLLLATPVFFAKGIVRKIIYPLFPAAMFAFFYWFKSSYLGLPFWNVNGDQQITMSLDILFNHFFKVLRNSIDFDCDQIWFAGYSNEVLDLMNQRWIVNLFTIPTLVLLLFFIPVMVVNLFTRKAARAYVGLLLLGFALALAAAGSVSPERVEMRWCFSVQVFVFAILCLTFNDLSDVLRGGFAVKDGLISRVVLSVLSGALAICFIYTNNFFLHAKGINFYIDNDQIKMGDLYSYTVEPMLADGKNRIYLTTSDNWVHDFDILFVQLKEVEDYVIDSPSNPGAMPEEPDLYFFVTFYE